jgi:hypothetical protein
MVAAVFVPQLAPRIRTGGRRVDEPLVHWQEFILRRGYGGG